MPTKWGQSVNEAVEKPRTHEFKADPANQDMMDWLNKKYPVEGAAPTFSADAPFEDISPDAPSFNPDEPFFDASQPFEDVQKDERSTTRKIMDAVWTTAKGAPETAIHLGTGLLSGAAGTIGGVAAAAGAWLDGEDSTNPSEAYQAVFEEVAHEATYQPRLESGQKVVQTMAVPFEWLAEQGKEVGDVIMETTGSPTAATAMRTATEGALYVLPYVSGKMRARELQRIDRKASDIAAGTLAMEGLSATELMGKVTKEEFAKGYKDGKDNMSDAAVDAAYADYLKQGELSELYGIDYTKPVEPISKEIVSRFQEEAVTMPQEAASVNWLADSVKEMIPPSLLQLEPIEAANVRVGQAMAQEVLQRVPVDRNVTLTPTQFRESVFGLDKDGNPKSRAQLDKDYKKYLSRSGTGDANLELINGERGRPFNYSEEMAYRVREQENVQRKLAEEEAAWLEKGVIDQEARIESLVARSSLPLEAAIIEEAVPGAHRKFPAIGKGQRGMINLFTKEEPKPVLAIEEGKLKVKVSTPTRNYVHRIGEALGLYKSVGELHPKMAASPTFRELVGFLERPEKHLTKTNELVKADIGELTHTQVGTRMSRVHEALDPLYGRLRIPGFTQRLGKVENEQLRRALTDKEIKGKGKVQDAARAIRQVLDEVWDAGVAILGENGRRLPGKIQGYLPRVFSKEFMSNRALQKQFVEMAMRKGMDQLAAERLLLDIIDRHGLPDMGTGKGTWRKNIGQSPVDKSSFLENERTMKGFSDKELSPFLETDVPTLLERYIHDASKRIEYARKMGPNEEVLTAMLDKAAAELQAAGKSLNRQDLQKLATLTEFAQGTYMRHANPLVKKMYNLAQTGINAAFLPLVTLASAPEVLLPLHRGTVKAYAKALAHTALIDSASYLASRMVRGLPKSKGYKLAEEVHKAAESAASERLTQLYAGDFSKLNNALFKFYLLTPFTKMANVLAINTYRYMATDYLKAIAQHPDGWKPSMPWSKAEHARMHDLLQYHGIDVAKGVEWARQGAKEEGAFYESMFKPGAVRFANNTVLHPRSAAMPTWFSNPYLAPVAHLSKYPFMFGNTIVKEAFFDTVAEIKKGNVYAGVANGGRHIMLGMGMVVMAHLINQLYDQVKYGDAGNPRKKDWTAVEHLEEAVNRVGLLGGLSKYRDGFVSETWGGSFIETMAGPTLATGGKLIGAAGQLATQGKTRELAREAARMVPVLGIIKSERDEIADDIQSWLEYFAPVGEEESKGRSGRKSKREGRKSKRKGRE